MSLSWGIREQKKSGANLLRLPRLFFFTPPGPTDTHTLRNARLAETEVRQPWKPVRAVTAIFARDLSFGISRFGAEG